MDSTKKIQLGLSIAVIVLISLYHTAEVKLNQSEQQIHSFNNSLNRETHLSEYYYTITEKQTKTIDELIEENVHLSNNITFQAIKINNLSNQLAESEIKLAQYKYLADKLTQERLFKTPKYEDVIKFARADQTKYNKWTKEYDCKSFAEEFIKNSINKGLYACFARVHFTNGDWHAVVEYNTNKGKIYIEPQSGEVIKLRKGMNYIKYTVDHWTDCIGGGL